MEAPPYISSPMPSNNNVQCKQVRVHPCLNVKKKNIENENVNNFIWSGCAG